MLLASSDSDHMVSPAGHCCRGPTLSVVVETRGCFLFLTPDVGSEKSHSILVYSEKKSWLNQSTLQKHHVGEILKQ